MVFCPLHDVFLKQGDSLELNCDSLNYNGKIKKFFSYGKVSLINNKTKLNSNELFYENRLLSAADPRDVNSLEDYRPHAVNVAAPFPPSSTALIDKCSGHCPLWVVGVNGHDAHDIDSPSFFNREEVDVVVSLIQVSCTQGSMKCPLA